MMLLALAATLFALLAARFLSSILRWFHVRSVLLKLPHPKESSWLVGTTDAANAPTKTHDLNARWAKQYGGVLYCRVLHVQFVLVYDPDLIAKLLSRDLALTKDPTYAMITRMTSGVGAANLVSMHTHDERWKLIRRGVAPAFSQKNMRHRAFGIVCKYAHQLIEALHSAGPDALVDVDALAMREAIDIIGEFGFNVPLGTLQGGGNSRVAPGIDLMTTLSALTEECALQMCRPWRMLLAAVHPGVRAVRHHFHAFWGVARRLLAEARASSTQGEEDDQSVVAHLLRLRDPATGKPLPDEVLESQIAIMYFAGSDTSAHTLAYTLYLLSQHPEAEAKVVAELDTAGLLAAPHAPDLRALEYDDLAKLTYLQACIKESQRLLPVVPAVGRQALGHEVKLGGFTFPANTNFVLSFYAMQRTYWEDGDKFKPERWLEQGADVYNSTLHHPSKVLPPGEYTGPPGPSDNGTATAVPSLVGLRSSGARGPAMGKRFTPFADGGPRDCVGQPLAKVNMAATLALLLGRFKFKLDPDFDQDSAQVSALTMRPGKGMRMYCVPRV